MRLAVIPFFVIIFSNASFGQRVSATLDRDKIVLGEQVSLQLKVEGVNPRSSFITAWFAFPDSINHLNIVKAGQEDTVDVNGLTTYLQQITITSYDSGRWAIPLQPIVVEDRVTGKKTTIKADSLFLQVLPVDVSALKDYHEIKDIIDVPAETDYTLIIAAAVSVVIVTILLILFFRKKKKPADKTAKPAFKVDALEDAIQKLQQLEKEMPQDKAQLKLFYTKLDEICREYFTRRMPVQVMQLTSDEVMFAIGVYLQDKQAKTAYHQLLRLVDAVKFARYTPDQPQHKDALKVAAATLQHIDKQIQIATYHVN